MEAVNYEPHERRLLVAVVHNAVREACLAPSGNPKAARPVSIDAIDFLFRTDAAGLDAYALWLDFDHEQFRRRLLAIMDGVPSKAINEQEARALRFNYRAWQNGMRPRGDDDDDDSEPAGPDGTLAR